MIKRYLIKKIKISRGIYFTYIKPKGKKYKDSEYFDKSFYTRGISDRQTLSAKKSPITAQYHYCSVELKILSYLLNNKIDVFNSAILDICSGSGHWISFYKTIGSNDLTGIDVSEKAVEYLKNKYSDDDNVSFYNGKASEVIGSIDKQIDIVNAIGVMFHIVDDSEWKYTIRKIARVIPKDGIFIAGGHFGILNGLNVQIDKNNHINKRLRSKNVWNKTLKKEGFSKVKFYKNNAYLGINDTLPENNIIIATK